jgi:TolB protein
MNIKKIFQFSVFSFALFLAAASAEAQEGGEIPVPKFVEPGNTPPIWVSVSGFTGEADSTLRFDLYVQGFNFTNADNAQFNISGSNNGNFQGRVTVRFNKSTIISKAYSGASIRREAHAFVDEFITALGRKPIGATKIAFKNDTGANSEIYVSDFDGHGAQAVTADHTIVAAPAWAPGRLALFYTSYKLGNPDIFFHDLSTGQRRAFARYSGLNTSASVSPDGKRVTMILSKSGSPDVYVCNTDGSNLLRLTATREDESSPCWSPDGEWICYATKIGERRVLCKVPSNGGQAVRIPTSGVLNPTEPDWSPDGKWIAFTAQMGGFEICVVPANGGAVTELVEGEDPSWSANSRTLVYVRRASGGRTLSLLDVPTKQYKDVSRFTGSNSQPSWAK